MYYIGAVLVIVVIWYLASYYKWRKNVYYYLEKLPGDPRYPIVGTEYRFLGISREELFKAFTENAKKYAPLFRAWNGSSPEVHIMKAEHLELILSNSSHLTKGGPYAALFPWLGEGLLTSTGSKWHQRRKLITPTFHFKILEHFVHVFVEKTEKLLDHLDEKANGNIFNIYRDITHCALDIICETAMGVNVDAMSNEDNEYIKSVYDITEIIVWKAFRPYIPEFVFYFLNHGRRFRRNLKVLHGFSNKIITERKDLLKRKRRNSNSCSFQENDTGSRKKRLSFLDLLLEASEDGKILNDEDIREEVNTFIFEGHDTTSSGMCWTLFLLGNNPEVQEKLFEEVRGVLQNKRTPSSIAELNKLKYLECVIKETLRLYPSVPFILRHIKQEIQIDDYKIPANTEIVLHIYTVHRTAEYFPDPDKFDPLRFLPENTAERHPYAYIPFSAGVRNCIGQKFAMLEEKTVIASIVNRYKVTSVERIEDAKICMDVLLRPADGVLVKLERRN